MRKIVATLLIFLSFVLHAHRMKVFVAPEGDMLVGYAYASGGGKLSGAKVTVFGKGQEKLAELQTDDQGCFSYKPKSRCQHRFVVDAGGGHKAEYTVDASELPPNLGALPERKAVEKSKPTDVSKRVESETAYLSAQIHSMRKQLEEHDEKVRIRDVLGGLGYIVGLMGVVLYMKTRKKTA